MNSLSQVLKWAQVWDETEVFSPDMNLTNEKGPVELNMTQTTHTLVRVSL